MDLASHQRAMLRLFRSSHLVTEDEDPYIERVAQSRNLLEARNNVFMWRVYVLERTCPLTFNLLKQRGLLKQAIEAYIAGCNISPFRETQAPAFLSELRDHHDTIVASVARFELALMKVKQGDASSYMIHFNVEPCTILNSLAQDLPLEDRPSEGDYDIVVSRDLPSNFQVYESLSGNIMKDCRASAA